MVRTRAVGVLLGIGGLAGAVWALAVPFLVPLRGEVAPVLSSALAWLLLCCYGWLTLVSALAAVEAVATGTTPQPRRCTPRFVRSLVAAACGVGLTAGVAGPAAAEPADATAQVRLLEGLPVPDRPDSPPSRPAGGQVPTLTVRAGDTLWHLARVHHVGWRALYAANREAVGGDPDLIHPGTRLVLPASRTEGPVR